MTRDRLNHAAKQTRPGRHIGPYRGVLKGLYKATGGGVVLTEKQNIFVKGISKGLNGTNAARAAGYSDKVAGVMAHKLLQRPAIQYAIAKERVEYQRINAMTKKRVMDGFLDAIDMAKTKADPLGMISGWREVARMCGYYEPVKHKLQVSVEGKIVVDRLNRLSDEELVKLAEGDTSVIDGDFTEVEETNPSDMSEEELLALTDADGSRDSEDEEAA